MSDNVNGAKVAACQHIVIGISTIENLANGSSIPKYGSLTVLHEKLGFVSFSRSFLVHCSVQILFFEDKLAEISLPAPDCFCHCLRSFQECSCPLVKSAIDIAWTPTQEVLRRV